MDSYLVAYDISDPKRLRKVATVCEDFGYRKQYSVFLCRLSRYRLCTLAVAAVRYNQLEQGPGAVHPAVRRSA